MSWATLHLTAPLLPRTRPRKTATESRYQRCVSSDSRAFANNIIIPTSATKRTYAEMSPIISDLISPSTSPVEQAKQTLLLAIATTQRGSETSSLQRGTIEEAQVAVEAFSPGAVDWSLLAGTWNVVYTTASDVLPLVKPPPSQFGPLQIPIKVGRVGQRFSSPEQGICQNLIDVEAQVPFLSGTTISLVVEASYEIRTNRSIALTFQKAGVGEIKAGDDLQNVLASPLLPRGAYNMQALMAVEEFSAFIPLTTRVPGLDSTARQPIGINYSITFLDENMFIGRAQGNGGTFIYVRDTLADL